MIGERAAKVFLIILQLAASTVQLSIMGSKVMYLIIANIICHASQIKKG